MWIRLGAMGLGYMWGKKYFRYTSYAVGTGFVALIAVGALLNKQERENAGPHGYRPGDIEFTQNGNQQYPHGLGNAVGVYYPNNPSANPASGTTVSLSPSAIKVFFSQKDSGLVQEALDEYRKGNKFASGDELLTYLDTLP